jgi:aryl-alcohol dehydrogenase-like predicted oxidoreductase
VNGIRLSSIGLGTWQFGSKEWGYGADYAHDEAGRIAARAIELGINLIDTAEIYGRNESERIVGKAIAGQRDEVFIATKLFPVTPLPNIIEKHGRASAERLGVDKIDLYQIHWPNPVVPIATQMQGMRRLVDGGVVQHVGVSNFGLGRWKAAESALGLPVLSNQVQYSLAVRKPDHELIPYAAGNDRLVIAYSPLAKGLLSGRYDATNLPKDSARRNDPLFVPENVTRAHDLIETLRTIAKSHDAKPSQVALAWVLSRPNVVAIPGASSVEQLELNAQAADLELSIDELAELTAASDAFKPIEGMSAWTQVAKGRLTRR